MGRGVPERVVAGFGGLFLIVDLHGDFGGWDWTLVEGEGLVELVEALVEEFSQVNGYRSCRLLSLVRPDQEAVQALSHPTPTFFSTNLLAAVSKYMLTLSLRIWSRRATPETTGTGLDSADSLPGWGGEYCVSRRP